MFGKLDHASRKYPEIFVNSDLIYTPTCDNYYHANFCVKLLSKFCYDETTNTHGGAGSYINNNCSYVKRNDLNISLDKTLESIVLDINKNLPKIRSLSVAAFVNTLIYRLQISV